MLRAVAPLVGLTLAAALLLSEGAIRPAAATATFTSATGGSDMVIDEFRSLSGPTFREAAAGEIGAGTIRFDLPNWIEFDTGSVITATVTDGGTCKGSSRPLRLGTPRSPLQSQNATVYPSWAEITVATHSTGTCLGTITWTGLRVRPTSYEPGNMYRAGTSAIAGIPGGTVVARLTTVQPTPAPTPTPVPVPGNDTFARAQAVSLPATVTGDNTTASTEPGEPTGCEYFTSSNWTVWYRVSPASTGVLVATTEGSSFSAIISLYTGSSLSTLAQVGCEGPGHVPALRETVVAGRTYFLQLSGTYGDRGPFKLALSLAPPLRNDAFSSAPALALPGTRSGNTQPATIEAGEPTADCGPGSHGTGATVWYRITPDRSATLVAQTDGTLWDTTLHLFRGSSVSSLSQVACNDNTNSTAGPSRLIVRVSAGVTYYLRLGGVGGFDGIQHPADGDFTLAVRLETPPPNDSFGRAAPLAVPASADGTTVGATRQAEEPSDVWCTYSPGGSVWYRVTAPAKGRLTIESTTSSTSFAPTVHLYTGTTLSGLSLLDCAGNRYPVSADVLAGQTYYIQVVGDGLTSGPFTLTTSLEPPPSNDDFGQAQSISLPAAVTGNTRAATNEPSEPPTQCEVWNSSKTVWYRLVPTTSGTLVADTGDNNFDTSLFVYRGTSLSNLTELACNERYDQTRSASGPFRARVSVPVAAGTTYYLRVAGQLGDYGTFGLQAAIYARPRNDNVGSAANLSVTATRSGTNIGATLQAFEGPEWGETDKTVWFRVTPPSAGSLTVTARSSAFYPVISLHDERSEGPPSAARRDSAYGNGVPATAQFTVDVQAGKSYLLRLGGEYEAAGDYSLTLSFSTDP